MSSDSTSATAENAELPEPLFLGLPGDAALPAVVGADKKWAQNLAQTVRDLSGEETQSVSVARIGDPVIRLPDPIGPPDVPLDDLPGAGGITTGESGGLPTGGQVGEAGRDHTNVETVVLAYLHPSKTDGLPPWVSEVNARVVERPQAEVLPSSHQRAAQEQADRPALPSRDEAVFDASVASASSLALVAGGFAAAYYFFAPSDES